jgi:hypothetical protein
MKYGNNIPPDGFCGYNVFAVLKREIENGCLRSDVPINDLRRFYPVAISIWDQSSSASCTDDSHYRELLKRFIKEAELKADDIKVF